MLHYRKGDNVEKELNKSDLPFDDCLPKGQQDFLWMHVKGGTKVNNVITYVKNALDKGECRTLVWSGSGGGVVKTISCAEILKRNYPLYQVTRMCYTNVEEHWLPQMDGLEELVANRQIPSLHILMTLDAIDDNVSGLQKPGTKTDFWVEYHRSQHSGSGAGTGNIQRRERQQGKRGNARGPHGTQQRQSKAPKPEEGHEKQDTSTPQQSESQSEQRDENKGKWKHKNRQSNPQQRQRQPQRQPQPQQHQQQQQKQHQQQGTNNNQSASQSTD